MVKIFKYIVKKKNTSLKNGKNFKEKHYKKEKW